MDQNLLHALCQNNLSIIMPTKVTVIIEKKQEKKTFLGLRKTSWSPLVTTEEIQDQQAGCCSSQPKKYNNQCHCLHTSGLTESYASQNQTAYDMVNYPEKHA
ncbi:unnamed protein product [Sphagnum balticum]